LTDREKKRQVSLTYIEVVCPIKVASCFIREAETGCSIDDPKINRDGIRALFLAQDYHNTFHLAHEGPMAVYLKQC
jgi:hypothetical protein